MTPNIRAALIAEAAHAGQTDKLGGPFIDHCRRVADRVTDTRQKAVALLHDVLEKGPGWDAERLAHEGIEPEVIAAVEAMSRQEEEAYPDFVRRAASNMLARPVKKADLEDNLYQARKAGLDETRYAEGLRQLREEFGI